MSNGGIILAGDLAETATVSFTDPFAQGADLENMLKPQLQPQAQFGSFLKIGLSWDKAETIGFAGLWGIESDFVGRIHVFEGELQRPGRLISVGRGSAEYSAAIYLLDEPLETTAITVEYFAGGGTVKAGYLHVGRALEAAEILSESWGTEYIDTGQVEEAEGGQQFSRKGTVRRNLKFSIEGDAHLFYGAPRAGNKSVARGSPTEVGAWTEITPKIAGARRWSVTVPASTINSLTWPNAFEIGDLVVVEYGTDEEPGSGFVTINQTAIQPGESYLEFTAAGTGLVIEANNSSPVSEIIEFELISAREALAPSRSTSIRSIVQEFGATRPVGILFRPSSPMLSHHHTIFGIAKWGEERKIGGDADRWQISGQLREAL